MRDIGEFPVPGLEIAGRVEQLCAASRRSLIENWLAEVAELFLEKKAAWSGYFNKTPTASTAMVERYFRSVNALLSRQLRFIVLRTMEYLRDFLVQFAEGNAFEGDYQDLTFTRLIFFYFVLQINTFAQPQVPNVSLY